MSSEKRTDRLSPRFWTAAQNWLNWDFSSSMAYANSIQFCHFYAKRTQMVLTITLWGKMLMSTTKEESIHLLRAEFR